MKGFLYSAILFFSVLWLFSCDTENNIAPRFDKTFIKLYGGEYKNQAVDLLPLDDGGFAILGSIINTSLNQVEDILFIVTDSVGHIRIQKQIGDSLEREQPVRMVHDPAGYVICGNYLLKSTQSPTPSQTAFIYRLTNEGVTIDKNTYDRWIFSDMSETADNSQLVLTGNYQNNHLGEMTVSRTDLTKSFNISFREDGSGVKVEDNNDYFPGTFRFLGTAGGGIKIKLWDLSQGGSFFDNGPICDSLSIPVGFLEGKYKSDDYIVLGYNDNQSVRWPSDPLYPSPTIKGPFISFILPIGSEKTIGNQEELHFLTNSSHDYSSLIPSCLYKYEGNHYLLLGTDTNTELKGKIRLLKLDEQFNVIADKTYGTGQTGDNGITLHILPDNSVVLLATVNYVPDQPGKYSKIALFKLTPDLELDY